MSDSNDNEQLKIIEKEMNRIKQKLRNNVSMRGNNDVANFASMAKTAEELTDGFNKVYFNNVSKSLIFKSGLSPYTDCLQIGILDRSLNNVSIINFGDNSVIKGSISTTYGLEPENYKYFVPNMEFVMKAIDPNLKEVYSEIDNIKHKILYIDIDYGNTSINGDLVIKGNLECEELNKRLNGFALIDHDHDLRYASIDHDHDLRYADKNHEHDLRYSLTTHKHDDEYASIDHDHDNAYIGFSRIVSELRNIPDLPSPLPEDDKRIPNQSAIESYCKDYLTVDKIKENEEMIQLLKGDKGDEGLSAFEVWVNEQPVIEGKTYTYDDYMNSIKGDKGDKGDVGLSAFEVWVEHQPVIEGKTYTYDDYVAAIETHDLLVDKVYSIQKDSEGNETKITLPQLLDKKSNVGHTHLAKDIIYKEEAGGGLVQEKITVEKQLDNLCSMVEGVTANGKKTNILSWIFGVGGTIVDIAEGAGLVYAVGALETQIATLQAQISALATKELTEDVVSALDAAGDIFNNSKSVWEGLKNFSDTFCKIRKRFRGYSQIASDDPSSLAGLIHL